MKTRAALAFAILALLGAGVDWVSKELAFRHLVVNPSIPCGLMQGRECACNPRGETNEVAVIKGFFYVAHTWNPGIVFGLGQGLGSVFLWISIAAVPAIIAIFWSMKNPGWVMTASLGLILGGTIGNMYDRIRWGAVRDFIKVILPVYGTWPVFNIADSCICVGVFLLTVEMILFDEKKKAPSPAPDPGVPPAVAPEPAAAPAPEPHGSDR